MRKGPIAEVYDKLILHGVSGPQLPSYGDDAAVIPFKDEYLLLAADGMMTRLLQNEPYAAGKASVMVTVNDIYSMGGRPLAMVNVLAGGDDAHRSKIIDGIRKGCEKLNVPMVGGHLHPDGETPALSVAILGRAKRLLRSHLADPGMTFSLRRTWTDGRGVHRSPVGMPIPEKPHKNYFFVWNPCPLSPSGNGPAPARM